MLQKRFTRLGAEMIWSPFDVIADFVLYFVLLLFGFFPPIEFGHLKLFNEIMKSALFETASNRKFAVQVFSRSLDEYTLCADPIQLCPKCI